MKKKIDKFNKDMPLIAALGGNGMQGRHWDQIQEHVGKDVRPRNDTTLKEMLEYNLGSHIEKIEEISVKDRMHRTFTHLNACYSTARRTCTANMFGEPLERHQRNTPSKNLSKKCKRIGKKLYSTCYHTEIQISIFLVVWTNFKFFWTIS